MNILYRVTLTPCERDELRARQTIAESVVGGQ